MVLVMVWMWQSNLICFHFTISFCDLNETLFILHFWFMSLSTQLCFCWMIYFFICFILLCLLVRFTYSENFNCSVQSFKSYFAVFKLFHFFLFFFDDIYCFSVEVFINSLEEVSAFYFSRLIWKTWSFNFVIYILLFHFNPHLPFHHLLPAKDI